MMRTTFAVLVALGLLSQTVAAQSPSDAAVKRAIGEVGEELEICSIYFLTVSACIEPQEPAVSRSYRENSDKVSGLAIQILRSIGGSDDAYAAQAKLYSAAMMKAMNMNCTNIAVLLQRYSKFCQQLSQNADPRLKEWMACAVAQQQSCGGPGLP